MISTVHPIGLYEIRCCAASRSPGSIFPEGCLSFDSVTVPVERAVAVRVAAQRLDGRSRVLEAEGFATSLMQH